MRDTLRLSRRLCALACLPYLAVGCDEPSPPSAARSAARSATTAEAKAEANGEAKEAKADPKVAAAHAQAVPGAKAKPRGPIINEAPPPLPPPTDPRLARLEPIAGDPPWIDGYSPEEDPCISGNWCGSIATATAIAPNAGVIATEMECPTRIVGSLEPSPIKGAKYAGLSTSNAMQGSLNQHGTELHRADGDGDACCYHWFEYCSGRPLLDAGKALRPAVVRGPRVSPLAPSSEGLAARSEPDPSVRGRLAEAWLGDALDEHASVAAFARVLAELTSLGAPADLLIATALAARDEVGHAQSCFAIASRFAGRALGPGPLPVPAARPTTLLQVAVSTFVEGCVGETTAALCAERAAALATDPDVIATLRQIADDEARHAALAWRTLAWALERGGPEVASAVQTAATSLGQPVPVDAAPHPDWNRFGQLDPAQRRQAIVDARQEIALPMLAQLQAAKR